MELLFPLPVWIVTLALCLLHAYRSPRADHVAAVVKAFALSVLWTAAAVAAFWGLVFLVDFVADGQSERALLIVIAGWAILYIAVALAAFGRPLETLAISLALSFIFALGWLLWRSERTTAPSTIALYGAGALFLLLVAALLPSEIRAMWRLHRARSAARRTPPDVAARDGLKSAVETTRALIRQWAEARRARDTVAAEQHDADLKYMQSEIVRCMRDGYPADFLVAREFVHAACERAGLYAAHTQTVLWWVARALDFPYPFDPQTPLTDRETKFLSLLAPGILDPTETKKCIDLLDVAVAGAKHHMSDRKAKLADVTSAELDQDLKALHPMPDFNAALGPGKATRLASGPNARVWSSEFGQVTINPDFPDGDTVTFTLCDLSIGDLVGLLECRMTAAAAKAVRDELNRREEGLAPFNVPFVTSKRTRND